MDQIMVWVGFIGGALIYLWYHRTHNAEAKRGAENLVCPHCQTRGSVSASSQVRSKGISGGKAAGAVMTGGASVFATGLAKNQRVRQLRCSNCNSSWVAA